MSLEHAILGLLAEHPRSGYDLKRRCFDGPLSPLWTADQAQIYRTLGRLEDTKLVASRRKRQVGKPDRLTYELTGTGCETLTDWLATPVAPMQARDPFLLQLYFAAPLDDEAILTVLEAERVRRQESLERLRTAAAELAADDSVADRTATLRQTAFEGAAARERAVIDWLDDCIEAVREGALPGSTAAGFGQRQLFGG